MRHIITLLFVVLATNLIAENKPITISGMPSNAPYYYTNEDGAPDGYIPNVAKAIMDDAGLSYEIVPNTMEPMYHYNSIDERDEFINIDDLHMTGVISVKKRSSFYYSIPYLSIEFYILSKKGTTYFGISDFEGKSLGVTKNHASEARKDVCKEDIGRFVSDTVITCPTLSQGLRSVANGELDYMMISEQCLTTRKDEIKELELEVHYGNFPPLDIAIASKDGELISKINKSIYRLKEKGTFDKLFAKYIIPDSRALFDRKVYTTMIISFVVVLLLLVVIYICRRVINKKVIAIKRVTANLSRAINAGKVSIWEYYSATQTINVISGDTRLDNIDFTSPNLDLKGVHPEDKEIIKSELAKLHLQNETKIEFTIRTKGEDGDYKWLRNIIEKIPAKSGYLLIGSCQDVSESVNMQMEVNSERETLQFVTDNTTMGFFIRDIETDDILYYNKGALNLFDINDDETVKNIWDYAHTEGAFEIVRQKDKELIETGDEITFNMHVSLINGKKMLLHVNERLATYKGKRCVIVIVLDYDKQMRLEVNDNILNLSIPLLKAYTWSYDGRNDSYTYGSGYDSEDKNISNALQADVKKANFVHPDYREELLQAIQGLIKTGSGDAQVKFLSRIENGKDYLWWESYMRAETKTIGNKSFTVIHGFNINIDEQTRNEIGIKAAMEKAEESERMKSMFLANMSHEIRTPLNAIIGFSDLMPQADEEEMTEYVNIIKMNGDILINLINDILDLSKIDAGVSFNLENINFSDLFNDLTTSLIYKQNNPEVEFIVDNPYETIMCNIDKNRIGQIITNFTTNAIKHTTQGHIKIGYSYINNALELYVEDTGRGIPADKQHLVFQRFQKLDTITRGTGLGLSIVAAIVQHMGGEYGFESQEGVGSRFWVRIKPEMTNIGEIKESEKSVSYRAIERCESSAGGNKLNILVAEDVQSNYMLIAAILREQNLTHVVNGEEAVKSVKKGGFDLVLMDIQMPVMDGIEATKEIRKFNKNIPILAVTANAFDADRVTAYEAGCNGFLAKPVNKQDLIKEIEKASENSALSGGGGKCLYVN